MVVQYSISKWAQFLKYLFPNGVEISLAPSLTSGLYVNLFIGEDPKNWDCYQDNTAPAMITPRAGYSTYDLFLDSGSGWEMLRDDTSHPIYTVDGSYTMTLLPKAQTVTSANVPGTSLGFFRHVVAPTGYDVTRMRNFANQFQRGTINQQLAYQRFATKDQRKVYYLNDLMNHRQPFGPTSRVK